MAEATEPDLEVVYRRYLASLVLFHQTAADAVGLPPTDYQAVNLLDLDGPMTSGELARRLALSTGATTRLVDRLVRSGLAQRVADPADRRRVVVQHTGRLPEGLAERLAEVRAPIGAAMAELTGPQIAGLRRYLEAATAAYGATASG